MSESGANEKLTLVFNDKSWHYKLIQYVWTKEFFIDSNEIDWKAMEQIDGKELTEMPFDNFPRLKKAKTVNFCPYCRAVVAAVPTLPFIWLWRRYPHKPKKARTHAEIMKASDRRSKIIRYISGTALIGIGAWRVLYDGEWTWLFWYGGLAAFVFKSPEILKWVTLKIQKIAEWNIKRNENKPKKVKKAKKPRKPSMILSKLHDKHEAICPPIFFVTAEKKEDMR